MKFLAIFLLCTAAAFGQYVGTINSQVYPIQMPDHPQHADQHDMRSEQSLLTTGGIIVTSGERPLSDFGLVKPEVSLGDAARAFRKEQGKKTILDK